MNAQENPDPSAYVKEFAGKSARRNIEGSIGHNLPQEASQELANATMEAGGF